ncbi:MAG: DUF3256 family protein [Bacteroidales bacterium]
MRSKLLLLSLIASCTTLLGQSAAVYFEIIPEQHLLQIESNRRKDMVDMKKAGQLARVPNRLGGTSELTELSDKYLRIETSENSTFEMKLFPFQEDEQMIAVIKTTCAPVCDSEISFYTTTWQPLSLKDHFRMPDRSDFVKDSVDRNDAGFRQAFQSIDMDLIKLTFDPVSNEVIASQSYSETVPDYIWKEIAPYFKNEIKIPVK